MNDPHVSLAAVVLAAGQSRRFGAANKLHVLIEDQPALARTLRCVSRALFQQRVVVINPADEETRRLAKVEGCNVVENPDYRAGMATSIAAGIRTVRHEADVAFMFLGDMPYIQPSTIKALVELACSCPHREDAIFAPRFAGRRGHPIGFGAGFFAELTLHTGDTGARHIIQQHSGKVHFIDVSDSGVLQDIDLPGDVERQS